VSYSAEFLNPSEAARRLGVSAKALRLYEQRGLMAPARTAAGWRAYGPAEMARAGEIISLRRLGLSLAQVSLVLGGDPACLEPALAAHQAVLERQVRQIAGTIERVRALRSGLAEGQAPSTGDLASLTRPAAEASLVLTLPWPWGGERFELSDIRPVTYIIGPLGSGKTRLAHAIAGALPDALFVGLDRLDDNGAGAQAKLDANSALRERVEGILAWLVDEGATPSPALVTLLTILESRKATILVVDMVEQGLDRATQEALGAYLRHGANDDPPLFLLTRSSSVLDLEAVAPNEAIILCPANHSPPSLVAPYPGAPGYEAVATCLASPEVRARTEGMIAWRPQVA
jgi:DNA-binding transcriptional MerR regulator